MCRIPLISNIRIDPVLRYLIMCASSYRSVIQQIYSNYVDYLLNIKEPIENCMKLQDIFQLFISMGLTDLEKTIRSLNNKNSTACEFKELCCWKETFCNFPCQIQELHNALIPIILKMWQKLSTPLNSYIHILSTFYQAQFFFS